MSIVEFYTSTQPTLIAPVYWLIGSVILQLAYASGGIFSPEPPSLRHH